jgi:ankyrin repeat protein
VRRTLEKCGDAIYVRSKYGGYLPLHHACQSGASLEVIQCLVEACPLSLAVTTESGYLPLHLCLLSSTKQEPALIDVVRYMLSKDQYPDAIRIPAVTDGMLPLHCACYYGANTAVIQTLLELWPLGASQANKENKTPLDLARHPIGFVEANREAIQLLEAATDGPLV